MSDNIIAIGPDSPGSRMRVSWEDPSEFAIIEEEVLVHSDVMDPAARLRKRGTTMILGEREAMWLHAKLAEWIAYAQTAALTEQAADLHESPGIGPELQPDDPERWYRETPGLFEPEEHVNHARICPTCSGALAKTEGGWKCASECPEISDDEMQRLLGRETQPRISP